MSRRAWLGLAFAVAVAAAACSRPALRVGSSGDYAPFSVAHPDGTWSGFDVEVARAYARDRGRALAIVPFRWPQLERDLADGAFDVAMSGVTVRGDRLASGRFTAAVARTRAVLLARAGAPPPRKVAVNRGGHLERLARERLPGVTLQPVDDNRALLDALRSASVDAVVSDALEAAPALAAGEVVVVRTLADDRKAYWLPAGGAALQADLDAWLLARERDGFLPALRARLLGSETGPAIEPAASWTVDLLGRRLLLMPAVAAAKRMAGLPVDDPRREADVVARAPEPVRALARAEIEAAKAVQRATSPDPPRESGAPGTPDAPGGSGSMEAVGGREASTAPGVLAGLRAAIDRVDVTLATALEAAAPIDAPAGVLLARLRMDAAVPGATDAVLAPLVDALRTVPAVSR